MAEVLIGDDTILNEINNFPVAIKTASQVALNINQKLSKAQYINKIESLKNHIIRGDIYEVNFCQEFFAENAHINPAETFDALNFLSPTPFAGYFKVYQQYILSATPERFMCKTRTKINFATY